jgi:hypothetical protein
MIVRLRPLLPALGLLALLAGPCPAAAAPGGTLTWGVHITSVSRFLDPAETHGLVIQKIMNDHAMHAPLYQLGLPKGVGPRLEESAAGVIPGFACNARYEDIRLKT